uniref:EMI domain-containing protein n=1 Tax=Eptatretus burgeri TaxID=7764 RepID=A0A8C4R846_EPTBU
MSRTRGERSLACEPLGLPPLMLLLLCLTCPWSPTGSALALEQSFGFAAFVQPFRTTSSSCYRRNWCSYIVSRKVSCPVINGTQTRLRRFYHHCTWPPECSGKVSYRVVVQPTFRITYRTVSAMEWRCCPGFSGKRCQNDCFDCKQIADLSTRLGSIENKVNLGINALSAQWDLQENPELQVHKDSQACQACQGQREKRAPWVLAVNCCRMDFIMILDTSKLPVHAWDSKRDGVEVITTQIASSVFEPASWEQEFAFIATSDAI